MSKRINTINTVLIPSTQPLFSQTFSSTPTTPTTSTTTKAIVQPWISYLEMAGRPNNCYFRNGIACGSSSHQIAGFPHTNWQQQIQMYSNGFSNEPLPLIRRMATTNHVLNKPSGQLSSPSSSAESVSPR